MAADSLAMDGYFATLERPVADPFMPNSYFVEQPTLTTSPTQMQPLVRSAMSGNPQYSYCGTNLYLRFQELDAAIKEARRLAHAVIRQQANSPSIVISSNSYFSGNTTIQNSIPSSVNAELETLASRLLEFATLEDDWDGYGGKAPPRNAINDAIAFIKSLGRRAVGLQPSANSSGEVSFFLRTTDSYLNVGIPGDETYSFFGIDSKQTKHYGDDRKIGGAGKDSELVKLLPQG